MGDTCLLPGHLTIADSPDLVELRTRPAALFAESGTRP
jgi:hypothetical protein